MSSAIKPEFAERLRTAEYIWFTTVREDGMPQPTPVWFIRQDDTFLIYSMPNAQKVKNIRHNPKVALSYSGSNDAGDYLVIMGEARIDETVPPVNQLPAYVEEYAQGIQDIGMTPESMGQAFSVAIRVTPTQVRGE
ncbi:MAG TPA: TIGR03667 family PPOX class F420-dependent oxidoreductase [Phototrophicaceae bacterium]|nr:TIGR03667 family PPOX class F420-dependent oxidoreductase [Phototrophicaceae bacterium]